MALVPFLAFFIAMLSVVVHYAGLTGFALVPFAIAAVLAVVGVIFGVKDYPVSSRFACVAAMVLAGTPFLVPMVQDFRYGQMERARAREMAPYYAEFDSNIADLTEKVLAYVERYGILPEYQGTDPVPFINAAGQLTQRPRMEGLFAPADPFARTRPLRWVAVPGMGVLIVSVGQDGEAQMPLPGVAMDGPPGHVFAPFAALGVDPRTVTFDREGSPLAIGDVVGWMGRGTYEEAFAPLFDAWDAANAASPMLPRPTRQRRTDVPIQGAHDARGAEKLLAEQKFLATLALASRGINERHRFPAQWSDEERRLDRTRGLALYQLGHFRAAADSLILYLEHEPNDALAHFYAGLSLLRGNNPRDARNHLAAAAQINPTASHVTQADALLSQLERNTQPTLPPVWVEGITQ